MIKTLLFFCCCYCCCSCSFIKSWQVDNPDNWAEEKIEEFIEEETGIDTDLTPFTGEEYIFDN
jgi:hypothetical protein